MKKLILGALMAVSILSGCVVVPGYYRGDDRGAFRGDVDHDHGPVGDHR